jgi:hypothetical protein
MDKALVLEGYGLQPVHKPWKIRGPLGPEGTNFSFVSILGINNSEICAGFSPGGMFSSISADITFFRTASSLPLNSTKRALRGASFFQSDGLELAFLRRTIRHPIPFAAARHKSP